MALIEVNFVSKSLLRTVTFNAIIPLDGLNKSDATRREKFRTAYLLHGSYGNHTDYIAGTRIQRWAEEHNIAVIMPAGENQFFIDKPKYSEYYGRFVAEELVNFTRNLFPLSEKREDTFIAGLSMGGYGALVNGLKYHETFGAIGALSPGLILNDILHQTKLFDDIGLSMDLYNYYLDGVDTIENSDKDYYYLIDKLRREKKEIPRLYIAIGKNDFLIEPVRKFKEYLDETGITVTYIEGKGKHDWDFWDTYTKKFIEWLCKNNNSKGEK